jgi:hypothetical protein
MLQTGVNCLLNSNRAHGGVENKDSGRSTIAKIDVIEVAEASFIAV